jgi:hypothetical protein
MQLSTNDVVTTNDGSEGTVLIDNSDGTYVVRVSGDARRYVGWQLRWIKCGKCGHAIDNQ